jgi:hypothetical protein
MKAKLLRWWPAVPALIILYAGGESFLEKYPRAAVPRKARFAGALAPDSLLLRIRADLGSSAEMPVPEKTAIAAATENPFRPIREPAAVAVSGALRIEPPPRRYVLRGTVGDQVATITNNAGQKQIVKTGERIDSAEVVSIETNKVVLRDRAGKFDLLLHK